MEQVLIRDRFALTISPVAGNIYLDPKKKAELHIWLSWRSNLGLSFTGKIQYVGYARFLISRTD